MIIYNFMGDNYITKIVGQFQFVEQNLLLNFVFPNYKFK